MRALAQRYAPDLTPCRIDLSDNTNAWGMPPAAREAVMSAQLSSRYPSPYSDELKAAIADYVGLPGPMVVTGCGSDDVLDATIRAFGRPGERLVFPAPTFVMIPAFASLNGLIPEPTPFEQLAESGARIIYVCSPNNPTGALTSPAQVEALLKQTSNGQFVIVDEAYAEFAGSSVVDLVRGNERLIVTRTMSKAFGLAGMRAGYALANPALVGAIEASRGPYMVGALAERAAVAALRQGRDWMTEHVALAISERDRLVAELRARSLEPLPSAANFVFVPVRGAMGIASGLQERGIRVRAFAEPDGLRITVAPRPIMDELLMALDEVLPCA